MKKDTKAVRHPWDETLVITVMIVSALCVLILLASYISSSGQASNMRVSQQATSETVLGMINSATVGEGSGKTTCNVVCTKRMEVCIAAHQGGLLTECGTKLNGNYSCLCTNPSRTVSIVPKVVLTEVKPAPVLSSKDICYNSCSEKCIVEGNSCKENCNTIVEECKSKCSGVLAFMCKSVCEIDGGTCNGNCISSAVCTLGCSASCNNLPVNCNEKCNAEGKTCIMPSQDGQRISCTTPITSTNYDCDCKVYTCKDSCANSGADCIDGTLNDQAITCSDQLPGLTGNFVCNCDWSYTCNKECTQKGKTCVKAYQETNEVNCSTIINKYKNYECTCE